MNIRILELIEGAKKAQGLTVIIDVFRAFSLECYLFEKGARKIYPIGKIEDAFAMKKEHPDYVLLGERGGAKVEGCDFGNSPSQIRDFDVSGKTIIHTTSAGTQGIVNAAAAGAQEIITGSLVNADAVVRYIRSRNPEEVSIVAMGKAGLSSAAEDVLCAEYLKARLENKDLSGREDMSGGAALAQLREKAAAMKDGDGAHFFNPATQEIFPEEDFYMCTQCCRFDFVIRVGKDTEGRLTTAPVL